MKSPHAVQSMVRRRVRRRRMWHRLRVAALVVLGVVALAAAAFGVDRMVVSLHRYYSSPSHSPHHAASSTTTNAPTTTTTPGPPACVGGQLSGQVATWRISNSTTYEIVELTNVSQSPCTLSGYPTLAVNGANGTALPAATQQVATLGSDVPGAPPGPTSVVIGPSGRAWFELTYPELCEHVLSPGAAPVTGPDVCYAGSVLLVTPPHTASPLIITQPLRFTYGIQGFQIGPFEPGYPPRYVPVPTTVPD